MIDTSTDNISNSPKLQKQKQRTFSPILESEDASNPFAEDIKELAIRTKQGISFGDEEEDGDRFDEEEAFRKKREHFQKTKSRSEHKSILIRVSSMTNCLIILLYLMGELCQYYLNLKIFLVSDL